MAIAPGQWATLVVQITDAQTLVERLVAYAGSIARRYRTQDAALKWIVAVASCAPFVGQLRGTSGIVADWMLALVPLIGLALPLLNHVKTVELAKDVGAEYGSLLAALSSLSRSFDHNEVPTDRRFIEVNERYEAIDVRLAALGAQLVDLPNIRSLREDVARTIPRVELPRQIEEAGRRRHDDVFLLLAPRRVSPQPDGPSVR